MKKLLLAFILLSLTYSCEQEQDNDEATREEEAQALQVLFDEIITMAAFVECNDPSEWDFIAVGEIYCGGNADYVAYSKNMGSINTVLFLEKVAQYTAKHKAFNTKWDVFCLLGPVPQPTGIECADGNAVLIY